MITVDEANQCINPMCVMEQRQLLDDNIALYSEAIKFTDAPAESDTGIVTRYENWGAAISCPMQREAMVRLMASLLQHSFIPRWEYENSICLSQE